MRPFHRGLAIGLAGVTAVAATAIAVALTGPVFGVAVGETWTFPRNDALMLLGGAAVFLIGGYLFAVDFMRHGDIAVVAPFRYLVILWAIIVGYIVWGEIPDVPMIIGTSLVIASGIYTLHRERKVARSSQVARMTAESDIDH